MKLFSMSIKCFSNVSECITTSSIYSKQQCDFKPAMTISIRLRNVAVAFVKLNGITLNSKSPSCVMNALFSFESLSVSNCQYSDRRSNVDTLHINVQNQSVTESFEQGMSLFVL
jgi:hypothetical protein